VRDQSALYEDQIIIIKSLIATARVDAAVEAAEELPTIQPTDPKLYLLAAGYLVKCGAAILARGDGNPQAEAIMARAVALLNKAVQNGVIRQKRTLEDKSLLPLHEREDFKKLLKSVDEPVHIG
jgi:hypothetical protein